METLTVMGQRAKTAAAQLAKTGITERNNALKAAADALLAKRDTIQAANAKDIEAAKKNQMKPAMIDRLTRPMPELKHGRRLVSDCAVR